LPTRQSPCTNSHPHRHTSEPNDHPLNATTHLHTSKQNNRPKNHDNHQRNNRRLEPRISKSPQYPPILLRRQLTTNHQAFAGDEKGAITTPLLRFVIRPDIPLYYKVKAHLALSAADEDDRWHNLAICRRHLNEAERALADCMDVCKDAGDVQRLRAIEVLIEEERRAVEERKEAYRQDD
jgi:hypothetical protein